MVANQPQPQPQAGPQKRLHRLDFFRPDQVVFFVTHDTTLSAPPPEMSLNEWVAQLSLQMSEDQTLSERPAQEFVDNLCDDEQLPQRQLNDWIDNLKDQLPKITVNEREWQLAEAPTRSYSFPPVIGNQVEEVPSEFQFNEQVPDPFSMIVCTFQNGELKTDQDRFNARQDLLNFIDALNSENSRSALSSTGLTLQGAFPNWLASSGANPKPYKSDSGGTGGPGSEPVPYRRSIDQAPYYFTNLINALEASGLPERDSYGQGVDVVVLDTSPCGHDLVLAYKELARVPRNNGQTFHPLINSLLGQSGKLKLYPASYDDLLRMGSTSLNKQGYQMEDHGLFVAGIIHSIAPEATIHLVEVLNQFGVGDFETIARGLAKAYGIARRNNRPVAVNCSLVFDLPDKGEQYIYQPTDDEFISDLDRIIEEELRSDIKTQLGDSEDPQEVQQATDELHWVRAIRVMCERLAKGGRQVIAAAGNEAHDAGKSRQAPDARYPAAFERVVGVGALPKNAERPKQRGKFDASSYSNLADKPAWSGVMALGGEPGAENGVLGIYLGNFPEIVVDDDDDNAAAQEHGWDKRGSRSKNGWAWWAGTSFATPILTGTIAAVLSKLSSQRSTQKAVKELGDKGIIGIGGTDAQENVMKDSLVQDVRPGP